MANTYVNIENYKFTIKNKNKIWHLDFYHKNKRVKKSTKLPANKSNLRYIKSEVIPQLIEELSGTKITEDTQHEPEEMKLHEFALMYFDTFQTEVKEHTFRKKRFHYYNHIKPYFGKMYLKDIKPITIQRWVGKLKKKYAYQTIKTYYSVLNNILQYACLNEFIVTNPTSALRGIFKKNGFIKYDEPDPFTEEELELIKNSDMIDYVKNFVLLAYFTGARPGELIALNWSDVNFEKRYIDVNKTIVHSQVGTTKTANSVRKIDLFDDAIEVLKKQYKLTHNKTNVFVNQRGRQFYSHDIIAYHFRKVLNELNIKGKYLYNLRHTFASTLLTNGIDIAYISKMLGHSNSAVTLQRYTKFIKINEEQRLNKIQHVSKVF